jgi:hypothetical protein
MSTVDTELRCEHDRRRARGARIDAAHAGLRDLEALTSGWPAMAPLDGRAGFDMAAATRWLPRYRRHYCNLLRVPPRGDT